jgi:hypothetical protein
MSATGYKSFDLAGSTLGRGRSLFLSVYLVLSAPVILVSLFISVLTFLGAIGALSIVDALVSLCCAAFVAHFIGLVSSVELPARRQRIWRWFALGALSELGLAVIFAKADNGALNELFYVVVLLVPCAVVGAALSFKRGTRDSTKLEVGVC